MKHITMLVACGALVCASVATRASAQARKADRDTIAARETRLREALANDESNAKGPEIARWLMPEQLYEISGIALIGDGRVLAHEDQTGTVYEIDYRRGVLIKRFSLGRERVRGDFEGITVAGERIFMLTSTGVLYDFAEGGNDAVVRYTVHDTRLASVCEFEGIAYDRNINSLVLACKEMKAKDAGPELVLYRWRLDRLDEHPQRVAVAVENVSGRGWKTFHPSDLTVDPATGNYVIVAARESAIISITPDGKMVYAKPLPGKHPQPEGVAITKDGILIISDESGHAAQKAGHRPVASISLYHWK